MRKRERQLMAEQKQTAAQLQAAQHREQEAQQVRPTLCTQRSCIIKPSHQACQEMLAARRSARESLCEMAQQNARLITALLDGKKQMAALQDTLTHERQLHEV